MKHIQIVFPVQILNLLLTNLFEICCKFEFTGAYRRSWFDMEDRSQYSYVKRYTLKPDIRSGGYI
jgi:hypothetical protein